MIKKILPAVMAVSLFSSTLLFANVSEKEALKQAVSGVQVSCNDNLVKFWSKINKKNKRSLKRYQNAYENCKHAMDALVYLVGDEAGLGANANQPPPIPGGGLPTCPPGPSPTETKPPQIVAPPMYVPPNELPPAYPPPPFASPAYTYP